MKEIARNGEMVLRENPYDGIDYTLTDRNESVLLPLDERDLDDLIEMFAGMAGYSVVSHETMEILTNEVESVMDSIDDPGWHEGYGETVEQALIEGEESLEDST